MNFLKEILGHSRWSASASVYFILIQAGLYLIITRYVSVEDLGVYALGSAIVFIMVTLLESAFPASLINTSTPSSSDFKAAMALNMNLSTYLFATTIICSLVVVAIYPNLQVPWVILLLSPILLLGAFNVVQLAGLKNDMRFAYLSVLEVITHTIHFVVTITLAYMGFGFWSLVFGLLAKYFATTVILQVTKRTYAPFTFNYKPYPWKKHFDFGKYILAEKGFSSFVSYADIFLVGHFFGLSTLGIYDVLKKLIMRPCILLYNSIEQIIYPILSKFKSQPEEYNKAYKDYMSIISFLFIFILSILYINAPYILKLFPVIYAEELNIFRIIVLLAMSTILLNPLDILMYSVGKTDKFLKWFVVTNIINLIIMVFAAQVSLTFLMWMMIVYNIILFLASFFMLVKPVIQLRLDVFYLPLVQAGFATALIFISSLLISNELIWAIITTITVTILFAYLAFKKQLFDL